MINDRNFKGKPSWYKVVAWDDNFEDGFVSDIFLTRGEAEDIFMNEFEGWKHTKLIKEVGNVIGECTGSVDVWVMDNHCYDI